jgi:hypothetical protein
VHHLVEEADVTDCGQGAGLGGRPGGVGDSDSWEGGQGA